MQLQVLRADDTLTHVALTGRLDLAGVQAVQDRFVFAIAPRRKPAIVDLTEVTFLASMGMGMLVSVAKALKPHGARLVLCGPVEMVHKTLVAAGMQHITTIVDTLEEALQSVG